MDKIVKLIIVILFALSLFWGEAQESVMQSAFQPGTARYPYWWDRAEPGLHQTWDRLEQMGVWDEFE